MGLYYRQDIPGSKNRWRGNVARAMRQSAQRRRCPKCERKGAMRKVGQWPEIVVKVCRYCGFETE